MPKREYVTRHVYRTPSGLFKDDRTKARVAPTEALRRVRIANVVQHQPRAEGGLWARKLVLAAPVEAPPRGPAFWTVKSFYSVVRKKYRFRQEFETVVRAPNEEAAWERFVSKIGENIRDEGVLGAFLKTNRAGVERTVGPETDVTFRVVEGRRVRVYHF